MINSAPVFLSYFGKQVLIAIINSAAAFFSSFWKTSSYWL